MFTGPVGPTARQHLVNDVEQDVFENTPIFIDVSQYFDEGGSTISYEFSTNNNALLTVNGTGSTMGLFRKADTQGSGIITIRAIAIAAYAQPRDASVSIAFTTVNDAPSMIKAIPDVEGPSVINLSEYFSDPNYNDHLSYDVHVSDSELVNATVDGTMLLLENGVSLDGNTAVTITAIDRLNASVNDTFIVTFVYVPPLEYQSTTYTSTSWTSIPLTEHAAAYRITLYGARGGNGDHGQGGSGGIVESVIKLPSNANGFKVINNLGSSSGGQRGAGYGGGAALVAVTYTDGTAKTILVAGGGGGGGFANGGSGPTYGGSAGLIAEAGPRGCGGAGCTNGGGGGGPTYNGGGGPAGPAGDGEFGPGRSGIGGISQITAEGISYGKGGGYNFGAYASGTGGGGWFGGGQGGGGMHIITGGGGGSNFVGRYNNAGSWVPHSNSQTFTDALTDQETGVTYWQQTSTNGHQSSAYVTIEVGPSINAVVG